MNYLYFDNMVQVQCISNNRHSIGDAINITYIVFTFPINFLLPVLVQNENGAYGLEGHSHTWPHGKHGCHNATAAPGYFHWET